MDVERREDLESKVYSRIMGIFFMVLFRVTARGSKSRVVDLSLMRGQAGSFWASWRAGMYLHSCKPSRLLIGNPSGHGVGPGGRR